MSNNQYDICVVGGAGHVGLPLAIVLASKGHRTLIYDLNQNSIDTIKSGKLPFIEEGGEELLERVLRNSMLGFTTDASSIMGVPNVILTIGTPVDEFHNPVWTIVPDCVNDLLPYLRKSKLLILRSTVSPGTTEHVQHLLEDQGLSLLVAFCPERVVQGKAIEEISTMAQIVSGTTLVAENAAADIFSSVGVSVVRLKPMEAEFAKLLCNTYRYIQFAAANQFYMMIEEAGCDFHKILKGIKQDYPRMKDFPGPGFAAGPCLHKDTLQLAAFANNQFELGHAAIHVNEGMPWYIINKIKAEYPLKKLKVGILGMAFKAESDDIRSSLSYKLKKLVKIHAAGVFTADPYVTVDPELKPVDEVIAKSDLLIIGAPHKIYKSIDLRGKPVFDIWNLR